jgi:MYXO-CTERM domain-containing protein
MHQRTRSTLLAASTILMATAVTRSGSASQCGDDYEIIAQDVVITVEPELACMKATVTGSNQPGCEQLTLELDNQCSSLLFLEGVNWVECANPTTESLDKCNNVDPGTTAPIPLDAEKEGSKLYRFTVHHEGKSFVVMVTFDAVDRAGCSVTAPGSTRGGWASAALLGLALVALGRRRR